MIYRVLADLVVLLHFAFILFVVVGGLLVWRWRRVAWAHLPAAVWGTLIMVVGWTCPLTPLEHLLRARGGEAGYAGGFIAHYIEPVIYPGGLTPGMHMALGTGVVVLNLPIYWRMARRLSAAGRGRGSGTGSPRRGARW